MFLLITAQLCPGGIGACTTDPVADSLRLPPPTSGPEPPAGEAPPLASGAAAAVSSASAAAASDAAARSSRSITSTLKQGTFKS